MKTNFSIIQLLFTACIVFSCSEMKENDDISADLLSIETKAVKDSPVFSAYDYCNKDGFWRQFNSLEGRIEATQIPEGQLADYSTEELLVLCISHPLANIYPAYNHELQAIHVIADRLNVFREFETREDAAEVLSSFFSKTTISEKQKSPCLKIEDKYSLSLLNCNFLELYISSARIPEVLQGKSKEILIENANRLYNYKKSRPDTYSWFSYGKDLLIVKEIKEGVASSEEADNLYGKLFRTSTPATKSLDDIVIDVHAGTTQLNTKCNRQTVTADRNRELTRDEYEQVMNEFLKEYPNGTIIGGDLNTITSTYNCHAYAWHMADNNTPAGYYWINSTYFDMTDDNLSKYWTDCYYQEIYDEASAEKIYYSWADHSAIKSDIDGYYTSKWGMGPLVTHMPSDCPYLMSNMRYFAHTHDCNHDSNGGGGNHNGGDNTGGGEDNGGDNDQPIEQLLPIINITANGTARVGQTITLQASQMYDTAMLEWSCDSPYGHFSNDHGRTTTFTADAAGWYAVTVEYNYYGTIMARGMTIIQVTL